jgi:hypothetical protein
MHDDEELKENLEAVTNANVRRKKRKSNLREQRHLRPHPNEPGGLERGQKFVQRMERKKQKRHKRDFPKVEELSTTLPSGLWRIGSGKDES